MCTFTNVRRCQGRPRKCLNDLDKDKIPTKRTAHSTIGHLNPIFGPNFGGFRVQSIHSVKLIILGSQRLTFDVSRIIIVEADAKMKSTSLTIVSDIQENIEILTPNGFLFQRLYDTLPLGLPTRVNQASQHEDLVEHSTFEKTKMYQKHRDFTQFQ